MSARPPSRPGSSELPGTIADAGLSPSGASSSERATGDIELIKAGTPELLIRGSLPAALTPFIGRERELRALADLIARDNMRLVTLTGPGGVGKTRLALEAARLAEPIFPDGVVYVPLAAIQDPSLVAAAIAQALGVAERDGLAPAEHVLSALRNRRLLLILDNFEHLVGQESGTLLADILRASPGVTALVTSRVLLQLTGEHTLIVPPLETPRPSTATIRPLEELAAFEAIQLFVDRAKAAYPGFSLSAENAPAVVAICQRLDGLPLAIELAASRSAVLSPAELLTRLDRRLPLLTGGPRDQPQRLRTMRNAIAWSYDLLDAAAQSLLRRLAVFVGGFTLSGAEAIADSQSMNSASVLDAMAALLTSSLIQRFEGPTAETRYAMLETVREFGLEQLTLAGEESSARSAHAAYYLGFMERADLTLWSTSNQEMLDRIEAEHDNLRAALTWSIEHAPETALRLAGQLGQFWSKRSHWSEGRMWLDRALLADAPRNSLARAVALSQFGGLASNQGDFATARLAFEEALALADALGDARTAAWSLRGLGIQCSNQGQLAEARDLFAQSLVRFREIDDRFGIARCLNDLGLVAAREGNQDQAIAYQEEALPIARETADDWQVCIILGNLGGAYYDRGDYARGETLTQEALELARRLDDTFGVAVNLYNLGNCVIQLGDVGGALVRYRESLSISVDLNERHLASRALDRLGVALHLAGSSRVGARLLGAAAAVHEAIGDTLYAAEDANLTERFQQIRKHLGDAVFDAAWASGHTLPFGQAISEALAHADTALLAYRAAPAHARVGLTVREGEVLRLLCEGHADKEIAHKLFISTRTASSHVASIIAKLGVDSRTAAVAAAFRRSLV